MAQNMLRHLDPCLMDSLGRSFATAEEYCPQQQIPCQRQLSSASHSLPKSFIAALHHAQLQVLPEELEIRIPAFAARRGQAKSETTLALCHSLVTSH